MDETLKKQLEITACKVRLGILEGVFNAKSGHPGGSLSIADLLTYLYFAKMNVYPDKPEETRAFKGSHSTCTLCNSCRKRLFSKGGAEVPQTYRCNASGSPLYLYPWRRYVLWIPWTGHFCCLWYGAFRKAHKRYL